MANLPNKTKLFILSLTSLFGVHLISPSVSQAVCPVCTLAVGAGLGVSRTLGVDDTTTSVWIGGLILSSSFWMIDYIRKKKPEYVTHITQILIIASMYLLVLLPLYLSKVIGLSHNTLWGIDKIMLGTFIGSAAFFFGMYLDKLQRSKYGKQFFNYQKVFFPVSLLVITSLIFFLITK